MSQTEPVQYVPRVDPAGRPLEGRVRQALTALAIILGWGVLIVVILWAHRGLDPAQPARLLGAVGLLTWAACEMLGGRNGPIWPISALAVAGALSLGYAGGLSMRELGYTHWVTGIATICGVSALAMMAFLFRFRLPGLVSPVVTFLVVALFLILYGADKDSLARVEGFSARGILAALMSTWWWAAAFGLFGAGALVLARRLDLKGDDFGIASARPLHLIGAGVTALVVGRVLAMGPWPLDMVTLGLIWIGAFYWALRINRVAVLIAIHFAIAKPTLYAFTTPLGWTPDLTEWSIMLTVVFVFDLAIWPRLHKVSLANGWTLGPGGRIPEERPGWTWRYWPYA